MGGFAFLAIFIGVLTLVGLYLLVRQLERSGGASLLPPSPVRELDTPSVATLVFNEHGQTLHINALARAWFQVEDDLYELERLTRFVTPKENFYALLTGEGQTSFRIGERWVTASATLVPTDDGWRNVITVQAVSQAQTVAGNTLDMSRVMHVINALNENLSAGMAVESSLQVILEIISQNMTIAAGEICLWDDERHFLEQRGWLGDTHYLLKLAEQGGGYALGQGVAGWVAQERAPLLVRGQNDRVNARDMLADNPYASAVAVPLIVDDLLIGTLSLFGKDTRTFDDASLAFVEAIGAAVASSVYNALVYNEQSQRITQIAALQDIAREVQSDVDAPKIFYSLNERIAKLIGADMCAVFLYDNERETLLPQLPFYGLPDHVAQMIQIPLPEGTPQRQIWEHQPYWFSNDLKDEPLVENLNLQPIVEVAGIRNTALLPLQLANQRIGIVIVSNRRGRDGFTPNDIQSLRVLSMQASIVVGSVRLYQRERLIDNELLGLQEMTEAIGALSHESEFFATITERIARLMRSEMCGVLLYDAQKRQLISRMPFYGVADDVVQNYRISLPTGSVMSELWQEEDYWYSNHVSTDTLVYEANLDELAERANVTRTLFAVMSSGGQRIGVVQVSNTADGSDYTERDARLLQIFATQATAIIENARLYREVQIRAEQAEGLRRIAELASAVITPEQSFEPVLHQISDFMESPVVFINVIDHNTNSLITYPRWSYGLDLAQLGVQDMGDPDFVKYSVVNTRRPFLSNDIRNDKRVLKGYRQIANRTEMLSSVLVPLVVGERVLGELGVANRISRPYEAQDIIALSTVASQITAALERLLLYEATGENLRRRLQELDAIARVSNELALTLEFNSILQIIRKEVIKTMNADGVEIVMLRPQNLWRDPQKPEVGEVVGDEVIARDMADIERDAIQRGTQPTLVLDYETEHKLKPLPEHGRSAVAAAILYLDQVIGVIHAYADAPNRFDERSAGFLMTIGTKAALGYQNATYYQQQMERGERLRQRVDQLNRIFELGQMLQSSNADPESLLEAVAYSVQQSVGYDVVLMLLVDERNGVLRRVAQAGLPIGVFESTRSQTMSLDALSDFLKPEYRISESYFFPIERVTEWYSPAIVALSTTFDQNRSLDIRGKEAWHDGDMLLVSISGQGGNLLGAMLLDRPHDNMRPDRQRIEVLEIFAHQAATMVENTRFFIESQRSAEQEAQFNTIMRTIANTLDLSEIASGVAQGVHALVPFTRMTLAISNEQNESFDYLRVLPNADGTMSVTQEQRTSLERTALGQAVKDRKSASYHPQSEDIRFLDDLKVWYRNGEQSSIILPLISGGECLGALHFGSDTPEGLASPEKRELIERVTQLISSSVQNAHLFNQAVNLQVLNRSVVESIQQGIVVLDASGRIVNVNDYMRQYYGWDSKALRQDLFTYQPELSEALGADLRKVLETGEPSIRLGYTTSREDGSLFVRNLYLYPFRSGTQVRGAVLLLEDVTERTQLEQAIESRANQLAALTEVATRITALLERDEIVRLALDEMGWVVPSNRASLWRRNGSLMVLEGVTGYANAELGQRIKIADDARLQEMVTSRQVVTETNAEGVTDILPSTEIARSWMAIPLANQGHVVGMLAVAHSTPDLYQSRGEQHVALAFSSQVAIALANAELFEQTFERSSELGTLLEAAQATSIRRDLDEVFKTVTDLMFSALDQMDCAIWTWNEVDNEAEVSFTASRDETQSYPYAPMGALLDLAQYPAHLRALTSRDVVVIADVAGSMAQEHYSTEIETLRKTARGARMIVPLVVGDQSIGLIQMEQLSSEERTLTQQKVRLARALGSQVAVAIENVRLSTEANVRFEELLTINQLSQAISSTLSLDDMLPIIREQVPSITKAEELYLALYDEEAAQITFPLAVRNNGETFTIDPRPLGTDEVSYVIKRKHSLSLGADYFSIDDLRKSMGITNGEGGARSYMGIPLTVGDQVLGVLAVRNNNRTRAFNLNDDRILSTVGAQLAAAIQNARLFQRISNFAAELNTLVESRTDELEAERDRLDTLYQITSELARTLDMEQLLERALGMVSKAVRAVDGVIMLSNPATDSLFCRASLNPNNLTYSEGEPHPYHPALEFAQWFLHNSDDHDHVLMVEDLHTVPSWDKNHPSKLRSALMVILESNEDPIGVMVLLSDKVGQFTENHLKLLVPAANQVAASINSADLYQLIRDQAERLGRLLRTEQDEAQKNSAILEGINDGVMLVDFTGKVVLFNSSAERVLQVSRHRVMNQKIDVLRDLFGEKAHDWQQLISDLAASIADKQPLESPERERLQLNDYFVSTYVAPVYSGQLFLGVVAVFRDVTRDVEAERTKNQFITNVSHEFRTPLTPIKGYTDLLLMGAGGELSEMQLQMVNTIKDNVERLTVLVNDVLNIAKIDNREVVTTMQMVSLHETLQGVVDQIGGRAQNQQKNFTVSVEVAHDVPRVRADRDKLLQIVGNLVDNAFKYTRPNGRIDVKARLEDDKKHVLISVTDTGVGIPEHFREAAWRRFERYDEHALELDVAGTGLGLALVKELVQLHNGETWFESQLGKGTTFYVRLPVEQPNYVTETLQALQAKQQLGD